MKTKIILLFLLVLTASYADPPAWNQIGGTQYSMVLMAQISLMDEPFTATGGNIAAAFGPGGTDDCRSLGSWQTPNPPYDGYWYFTIVGNENGETISFKIYDAAADSVFSCGETILFENNLTVGSASAPFQLTIQESFIAGSISLTTFTPPAGDLEDVLISCENYTINPDENGYYEIPLTSGIYDVTAELNGYTSVTLNDLQLQGTQAITNADINLIDWQEISGTQYSMVIMARAEIAGNEIIGGTGNVVAAFGPDSYEDCRAIASWQEDNPPYWNGYWYFDVVSNLEGEEITFTIYNNDTEEFSDCYQSISFVNNTTLGSPTEPFLISDGVYQEFDLIQNWNWISFNLEMDDPAISTVFSQLGPDIFQVKTQNNSATNYAGNWIGDLTQIETASAHLIKMNNSFNDFIVEGIPLDPTLPIALDAGWNWISYYPQNSLSIGTALQSISENVFQIKDQTQSASYYDPPGIWVGNLETLQPGTGYKVQMNNADDLYYLPSEQSIQKLEKEERNDPPFWEIISGTEYSMVLMAAVEMDGEPFTNEAENQIGVFGHEGETDCRSIGVWQEANPPLYNGFWYFTIVGNTIGDTLDFKLYDSALDEVFDCNETIIFENNTTLGDPANPLPITCNTINAEKVTIPKIQEFNNYPNPFNPTTKIRLEISKDIVFAQVVIYNIRGQKIKELYVGRLSAGIHSFHWNGKDDFEQQVRSGIYFYTLRTEEFEISRKMLLLQ